MAMRSSRGSLKRSRSLSAEDWIRAATEVLVEEGVGAVAVEPLAVRLGATKGSFYHHFENRHALIVAALEEWESAQTEAVIERLQLIGYPGERLRAVMTAAITDRAGGLRDAALLVSGTHPLVRPVVARVTERRLRYMTETYMELGLPKARARRRARLLYLSYLGLFEYVRGLDVEISDAELRAHAEELVSALVPPAP
jgi:AcrR family transcriptional regulator